MRHVIPLTIALLFISCAEKPGHPSLFFDSAMLQGYRSRVLTDPVGQDIIARAKDMAANGIRSENLGFHTRIVGSKNYADDMEILAFAYLMTGDTLLAAKAKQVLLDLCGRPYWGPEPQTDYADRLTAERWPPDAAEWSADLTTSYFCKSVAAVYDWLYEYLSPDERSVVEEALAVKGAANIYDDSMAGVWWSKAYDSNFCGTLHAGLGLAALALLDRHPDAPVWLARSEELVGRYLDHIGEDGGWIEGMYYLGAGIIDVVYFADALRRMTGRDIYRHPRLQKVPEFMLYQFVPGQDRASLFSNFSDAPPWCEYHIPLAYRLAAEYRDPAAQWMALELNRWRLRARDRGVRLKLEHKLFEYLWHDSGLAEQRPESWVDKTPARLFSGAGWAVMRSGWEDGAVFFALKSGPIGHFHRHLDINSFILWTAGDKPVTELGRGPYSSAYLSPEGIETPWVGSIGHNTILVNGQSQRTADEYMRMQAGDYQYQGTIQEFTTTRDHDYMLADGTSAYGPPLERFHRHVVYLRPNQFVIIDDLRASEPSRFDWLLHSEGTVHQTGNQLNIEAGESRVAVQIVTPEKVKMELRDDQQTPQVGKIPYAVVTPTGIHERIQIISVLSLLNDNQLIPECRYNRIENEAELLLRITNGSLINKIVITIRENQDRLDVTMDRPE